MCLAGCGCRACFVAFFTCLILLQVLMISHLIQRSLNVLQSAPFYRVSISNTKDSVPVYRLRFGRKGRICSASRIQAHANAPRRAFCGSSRRCLAHFIYSSSRRRSAAGCLRRLVTVLRASRQQDHADVPRLGVSAAPRGGASPTPATSTSR